MSLAFPVATPYRLGGTNTLGVLTTDRQIFRMDGVPWSWLGCSAFPLCDLFRQGRLSDVDAFLNAYAGGRVLRVWDYVGSGWGAAAWSSADSAVWIAFLRYVRARGWFVSLTLLTDDDPNRIPVARALVDAITSAGCDNVLYEAGNEPETNKNINTAALVPVLRASGRPWSTGNYENSAKWSGTHGLYHPARTADFARRAHDAYEYFHGGGPNNPSDPACPAPWVNDETAKLQDVPRDWAAWRAHIAASFLFGGGITIHTETGKHAQLPTPEEQTLWALAVEVAALIPADAALGSYRRIPADKEPGQTAEGRTYVIGERYMVRCQQARTGCPEPGWTALDDVDVLWGR